MAVPDILPRMQSLKPAVEVEHAFKGYGDENLILNNMNMTVPQGSIYGLLGASGCGKTTLLSCIVGIKSLDSGNIRVFGSKPGTKESGIPGPIIGYMPQDIALFPVFSIKEIMMYFGHIYGMSRAEIQSRTEFIANFLALPDVDRLVCSLSGGQQRRVSLAVTMIHSPALLILDEPTVGVDPLLRESIWSHLIDISTNKGTTIIITTHYIEEARQADTIGLMRNGRLMAENHPHALLKEYDSDLLEDIVLKLCKKDLMLISNENNLSDSTSNSSSDDSAIVKNTFKSDILRPQESTKNIVGLKYKKRSPDYNTLNFRRRSSTHPPLARLQYAKDNQPKYSKSTFKKIGVVMLGHHWTMIRHPPFILFQVFLPALQIFLFSFIMGKEPANLKFGVVNHELPNATDFQNYCMHRVDTCFSDGLSCNYLKLLQDDNAFNWVVMGSEELALQSVQSGDSVGFISIPANFTSHMRDKFLLRNFVENDTIIGSSIAARVDFSRKLTSSFILKNMYSRYLTFVENIAMQCGADPKVLELPLKFNNVFGDERIDEEMELAAYFQPTYVLWIIATLTMGCAVIIILDRKAGLTDRKTVAGLTFLEDLLARLFYEGFITVIQLALSFAILIFVFNFTAKGSLLLFIALSLFMGITGLSFGVMLGSLCNEPIEAIMVIVLINMVTVTSSGGAWPLATIAPTVRWFSHLLPVTIPLESARSIVSRGWGLDHYIVYRGFGVCLLWISFNCIFSIILQKIRK